MAINVDALKNKIRNEVQGKHTAGTRNTTGSTVQSQASQQAKSSNAQTKGSWNPKAQAQETVKHEAQRVSQPTSQRQTQTQQTQPTQRQTNQQVSAQRAVESIKASVQNAPTVQQSATQQTKTANQTKQTQTQKQERTRWDTIKTIVETAAKSNKYTAPIMQVADAVERKSTPQVKYSVKADTGKNKQDENKSFTRKVTETASDIIRSIPEAIANNRENRSIQFGLSDAEQERIARERGASDEDIALAKQAFAENINYINRNAQHGHTYEKMVENQMRTAGGLPMDSWLRFLPDDDGNIVDRSLNSARAGVLMHGQGLTGLQAFAGKRLGAGDYLQDRLDDYRYQQLLSQQALSGDNQGAYDRIFANSVSNLLTGLETTALGQLGAMSPNTGRLENLGLGNMSLNAFGNAYGNVMTGGMGEQYTGDDAAATRYALASAANELGQEKMFDVLGALSGGKITENTIPGANVFGLGSFITEAAEEGTGALVDPFATAMLDENPLTDPLGYAKRVGEIYGEQGLAGTMQNVRDSAIEGGLGGVMGGVMSNPVQSARQIATDVRGYSNARKLSSALKWARQNSDENGRINVGQPKYLNKQIPSLNLAGVSAKDSREIEFEATPWSPNFKDGSYDYEKVDDGSLPVEMQGLKRAGQIAGNDAQSDLLGEILNDGFDAYTNFYIGDPTNDSDLPLNDANMIEAFNHIRDMRGALGYGALMSTSPKVRKDAQDANAFVVWDSIERCGADGVDNHVDPEVVNKTIAISNRVGIPFEFLPDEFFTMKDGSRAGGWFAPGTRDKHGLRTGVIQLPISAANDVDEYIDVFLHEVTHSTEGTPEYYRLANALREIDGTVGDAYYTDLANGEDVTPEDYGKANFGVLYDSRGRLHRGENISLDEGNVIGLDEDGEPVIESHFEDKESPGKKIIPMDAIAKDPRHMHGIEHYANLVGNFVRRLADEGKYYTGNEATFKDILAELGGENVALRDPISFLKDAMKRVTTLDLSKENKRKVEKRIKRLLEDAMDASVFAETMGTVYDSRGSGQLKVEVNRVMRKGGTPVSVIPGRFNKDGSPMLVRDAVHLIDTNQNIPYDGVHEYQIPRYKRSTYRSGSDSWDNYTQGRIDGNYAIMPQDLGNYSYKQDLSKAGLTRADIEEFSNAVARVMNDDVDTPVTKAVFDKVAKKNEKAKALGFETFKRMIDDYDGRYAEYAEESMNEESKEADLSRQFKEPGDYLAGQGMAPSDAERLGENLKNKGDYSKSNYDRGVKSLKKNRGFTEEQAKAFLDDFKNQYNERYSQGLEKAKKKADAKAQREQAKAQKAERKKSEKAKDREAFNRLMAEDAREQRNAQKNKNQKLNYYFDSRGRLIDAATGKPVKNVKRTNLNEQSTPKQTDEREAYFTDSEIERIDAALKGGAIDEHEKEIVERAKKLQKTEWSVEFYKKVNDSFKNTVEEAYKEDDSITTESEEYKDFLQKMYDFASYEQYDSSGGFDIDVLRAISDWNGNHPNAQIDAGETDTGFYINDDSFTRETDVLDKIAEFTNSQNSSETEQKKDTPRKTDSQIYNETFNPTANEKIKNTEEVKTEENREEERKEETPKEETAEQQKVEYPLTEPSPTELAETLKSENSDDKFARILNEIDNPRAERTGNDEELNSVLAIAYYRLGASVEHANALADRKMSTGNSRTRYAPVMEDIMKEHPELTLKEAKALLANIHSRYNDMVKTAKSQRNKQGFTRQQAQNVETENVMDAETTVRQQAEEPTNNGTLEQAMVSEPQNVAENKTEEPTKQETKQTSEKVEATAENSESKTILDTVAQMRAENNSTKKIEEYYKSLGMDDATAKEVAEFTTDGVKMEREGAGNAETLKRAANQIAQKGEMTYEDAFKQLVDAKKNSWDKSREILKERETTSKTNTENKTKKDKVKQAKAVTDDIVKNLEKETGKKATKEQKQVAETVGDTIAEQTAEDRQIEAGYWAEFDKAFDETLGSTETSVRQNIEKMNKMKFPNISKAHKEMANKYFKEKPVIHRSDMTKNSKEWFDKVGLNGASAWAQWTLDKHLALPAVIFDKVNYARQQADTALRDFELQYQREIKPIKDAGYTVGRTSFLDSKKNKLQEVTVGGKTYKFEDIKGIKDATRELIGVAKPLEELYQTRKSDAARLLATPVEGALETPMSTATKIEKWVGRLNKQLEAEGKLKNGKIEINQELLNDYIMETDEKQRHKIFEQMMTEIGEQLPKDAIDMFHQLRMTNMLFNGPTQMRNIVSNFATGQMFLGSNVVATGMEKLLPKEQRTRAIVPGKDGIKFAKQYRLESGYVDDVAKDDRFNTQIAQRLSGAFPNSNVFGRLMNKKAKATAWMVEGGDKIFINPQADYYMATTLKARGYEIQQKDGKYIAVDKNGKEISKEAMDKVAEHAKSIAEQATFHDVNKLAEKLSNFQKNPNLFKGKTANKVFGEMFSVFQPYYKTPANVLRRAIEFSPQALIFNTIAGGVQVAQGKMDANTYINKLAKGTTGLGLAMIGGLLANMGVLVKGAPDDDDDEEEYYRENIFGVQPWSLHLGDSYYSLDWLLPFASPFLIGADFHETLKERGINPLDWTAEDYLKAFTSYNVILSASYLQNPVEMLSNAVNAGSSEFGEFDYVAAAREVGETYIENAVNQVLPADWAGWNRVIDPVKRTQAGNNLYERVRNSIYAKVPFLSTNLEPAVDQKGQVIGNTGENVLERVYHYKIAPYKKTTDTHDLYDEILMENKAAPKTQWQLKGALKGSLGDHDMDWAKDFSPKDYTAAKKTYYGTYNQYTKDLADLDEYEGLGQTAKDSVYGKLDSLAMNNAKAEYFKKANDNSIEVEMDIYTKEQRVALEAERLYGISPAEFFTMKQHGLSGNREALYMMAVYDNWKDPNDPSKSYLDYLREETSEDGYLTYSAVGINRSMFNKSPSELSELEYYYLKKDGGVSIYEQAEAYRKAANKEAQDAVVQGFKDTRNGKTDNKGTGGGKGTGSKGKGSSGGRKKSSTKTTKTKTTSTKNSSGRRGRRSGGGGGGGSSVDADTLALFERFMKYANGALKSPSKSTSSIKASVSTSSADSALFDRIVNSSKSDVEKLKRELGLK